MTRTSLPGIVIFTVALLAGQYAAPAREGDDPELIELMELIDEGIRGRRPDPNMQLLLCAAAAEPDPSRSLARFLELMAFGADAHAEGPDGFTPLHQFAHYQHLEVVKLLVEVYGVDVNARCSVAGVTALIGASSRLRGDAAVVGYLLERGADPRVSSGPHGPPVDFTTAALQCDHYQQPASKALVEAAVVEWDAEQRRWESHGSRLDAYSPEAAAVDVDQDGRLTWAEVVRFRASARRWPRASCPHVGGGRRSSASR